MPPIVESLTLERLSDLKAMLGADGLLAEDAKHRDYWLALLANPFRRNSEVLIARSGATVEEMAAIDRRPFGRGEDESRMASLPPAPAGWFNSKTQESREKSRLSCNLDYFQTPESPCPSMRSAFFTDDRAGTSDKRKGPATVPRPLWAQNTGRRAEDQGLATVPRPLRAQSSSRPAAGRKGPATVPRPSWAQNTGRRAED
jgi:hypothetical protein